MELKTNQMQSKQLPKDSTINLFDLYQLFLNIRFIYLKECDHIIEVDGMDKHMEVEVVKGGVSVKTCPKCTTPIKSSIRYQSLLCQKMKDIVAIKKKIFGRDERVKRDLADIVSELQHRQGSNHIPEFKMFLQNLTYSVSVNASGKIKREMVKINKVRNKDFGEK